MASPPYGFIYDSLASASMPEWVPAEPPRVPDETDEPFINAAYRMGAIYLDGWVVRIMEMSMEMSCDPPIFEYMSPRGRLRPFGTQPRGIGTFGTLGEECEALRAVLGAMGRPDRILAFHDRSYTVTREVGGYRGGEQFEVECRTQWGGRYQAIVMPDDRVRQIQQRPPAQPAGLRRSRFVVRSGAAPLLGLHTARCTLATAELLGLTQQTIEPDGIIPWQQRHRRVYGLIARAEPGTVTLDGLAYQIDAPEPEKAEWDFAVDPTSTLDFWSNRALDVLRGTLRLGPLGEPMSIGNYYPSCSPQMRRPNGSPGLERLGLIVPFGIENGIPKGTAADTRAIEQEEARRRHEEALSEQQRQREIEKREKEQAKERSLALLQEHLTPEQRQQWQESNSFEVETKAGRRYRIRSGSCQNVDLISKTGAAEKSDLCVVPSDGQYPVGDVLLMQLQMLRDDEAGFLLTHMTGDYYEGDDDDD